MKDDSGISENDAAGFKESIVDEASMKTNA
jgi:hypothetical protein